MRGEMWESGVTTMEYQYDPKADCAYILINFYRIVTPRRLMRQDLLTMQQRERL